MKKLITAITLATLVASPAFATPVDSVTVGAVLCAATAAIATIGGRALHQIGRINEMRHQPAVCNRG
jgi:hypothetical protein